MWEDMLSNHDVLMGVWEAASKGESKHHAVCLFMLSHMPSHLNIIKELYGKDISLYIHPKKYPRTVIYFLYNRGQYS